jgi:hypothetical protein
MPHEAAHAGVQRARGVLHGGCYSSFYLHRCRVCEGPITQPKRGTRLICKKSKCRNTWQANEGFGRYAAPESSKPSQEVPIPCGSASASTPVRGWRQIAGPALTPSQLHCATLGGSATDEVRRIEAKNRAAQKVPKLEETEIEANAEFTEANWTEVVSPDGVRCFVTKSAPSAKVITETITVATVIPDDLSIPEFLRRQS